MITEEQADRIYAKMQENMSSAFTEKDLDALTVVMTSEVVIKAFGRSLAYCQLIRNEMSQINMAEPTAPVLFTRHQGRIEGANEMISGLLRLITMSEESDEEEDNENGSS